jgi:3-phenylpropionate/cinnamic acid dioxygenase small subunit
MTPSIEAFLYEEAALLDEWRLRDWLRLCAPDAVYWVPAGPSPGTHDPQTQVSIAYDDRRRLEERVARLLSGDAHAQNPPSQTVRLLSNIRVISRADDQAVVRSNFVLYESRLGREHHFAGTLTHTLVHHDGGWLIRQKKVDLVQSANFITNLAFIV